MSLEYSYFCIAMHQTYFTLRRQEASWIDVEEVPANYDSCRNLTNQNTDMVAVGSYQ